MSIVLSFIDFNNIQFAIDNCSFMNLTTEQTSLFKFKFNTITISNSIFHQSNVNFISPYELTLQISNTTFENASRGLELQFSNAIIKNSTFRYLGDESYLGGAIYSQDSNISITDSLFDNNVALRGGAINPTCSITSTCDFYYENILFSNN